MVSSSHPSMNLINQVWDSIESGGYRWVPNPSQMEAIHDEFGRFQSDCWRETYAIDGAAESVESRSVYALYTLRDGFQKRYDYGSFNEDEVAQYAMDGQIVEFVYDPVLFAPSFHGS